MRVASWSASLLAVVAAPVFGQAALCQQFDVQIRGAEKQIAADTVEGARDQGSARATGRAIRTNAHWAEIQVALTQMEIHHCAPLARVIGGDPYLAAAATCQADRLKARAGASPASCNQAKWVPAAPKPAK